MNPDTETNYLNLARTRGFQPDTLVLSDGCKAFWMGAKSAEKIVVYFHGNAVCIFLLNMA